MHNSLAAELAGTVKIFRPKGLRALNRLSFRTSRLRPETSSSDKYSEYCCLMSANVSCSGVARTVVREGNMKLNSLAFFDRGGAHSDFSATDDTLAPLDVPGVVLSWSVILLADDDGVECERN